MHSWVLESLAQLAYWVVFVVVRKRERYNVFVCKCT